MSIVSDKAHTVQSFQKILLPPERLFAAWIDPGMMKTWFFKTAANEIRGIEVEPRVGGKFLIREAAADGEEVEHTGEYLAFDRPRRLMFSLESPRHFPGSSVVSIDITAGGEGSWMSFAQTGAKKEVMAEVWRQMFRRMQDELA